MPTVASDFSFLSDDLRRQREIAQEALEEAKRVDALLSETTDPNLKNKLTQTKDTLLRVARGLAANATLTSTAATVTLSGAGKLDITLE